MFSLAFIYTSSFISGAVLIAFEILSSRLLGPTLGSSLFTWSNIIAMVLMGLACGNFTAGILMKRKSVQFFWIEIALFSASLIMSLIGYFSFDYLSDLQKMNWPFWLETLLASFVTTFFISFLLGLIQPFIYSFSLQSSKNHGQTVSFLSATNTLGSLTGALFLNLFLLYFLSLSLHQAIAVFSILLISPAIFNFRLRNRSRKELALISSLVLAILFISTKNLSFEHPSLRKNAQVLKNQNGIYNSVQVVDFPYALDNQIPTQVRALDMVGTQLSHSAIQLNDEKKSIGHYPEMMRLPWTTNRNIKNVLMLGMGAGIIVRDLARSDLDVQIDSVDIDKNLLKIAEDFFGYPKSDKIKNYFMDARIFVHKQIASKQKYDLIFQDLYGLNANPPEHVFTYEFFNELSQILNPGGSILINTVQFKSPFGQKRIVTDAIYSTLKEAFPNHTVYALNPYGFQDPDANKKKYLNVVFWITDSTPNFTDFDSFLTHSNYKSPLTFNTNTFQQALLNPNLTAPITDSRNPLPFYSFR